MSMDLIGQNPRNSQGKSFGANIYWWGPLVTMVLRADPGTARRCPSWWLNDHQGLGPRDARTLGRKLRQAVADGLVRQIARQHGAVWQEECQTGPYTVPAHWQIRDEQDQPRSGMNEKKTLELAAFMENCGGFEIW